MLALPSRQEQAAGTPTDKRRSSGASQPLCVLGVGDGGVEELAAHLDDSTVSWALLRFQVGGGTFARSKTVAIHGNGAETPVMLRGWLNARKTEMLPMLGDVNAHVEVTSAKELTIEFLCERLLPLFSSDSLDYSLQALRAEYGKTVAQMQQKAEEAARKQAEEEADAAKALVVTYMPTREEALRAVGEDRCSYNWALLEPNKLELYAAGFGGVDEMKAALDPDRVLFGILRLSFGCSDRAAAALGVVALRFVPPITKHIFIHWVGPSVGVVRRGKWNARLNEACKIIAAGSATAFKREAHGLNDLELEDLVCELRRLTVVDGSAAKDGFASGRITEEEYFLALAEEAREREAAAHAKKQEDARRPAQEEEAARQRRQQQQKEKAQADLPDLRTAIDTVSAQSGRWNWVLCGITKEAAMAPPLPLALGRLPSSPVRSRRPVPSASPFGGV